MAEDSGKRRAEKSEAGFTLMELVMVVVILGMIAALVGPGIMKKFTQSREQIAKIQISNIESGLQIYAFDMGRYPTTAEGLQALVQNPSGANSWRGPYLEKGLPSDPWDMPYTYKSPGRQGDFDICSSGPDGVEGTDDDVCNW
jgi:general secretion pathway protein G